MLIQRPPVTNKRLIKFVRKYFSSYVRTYLIYWRNFSIKIKHLIIIEVNNTLSVKYLRCCVSCKWSWKLHSSFTSRRRRKETSSSSVSKLACCDHWRACFGAIFSGIGRCSQRSDQSKFIILPSFYVCFITNKGQSGVLLSYSTNFVVSTCLLIFVLFFLNVPKLRGFCCFITVSLSFSHSCFLVSIQLLNRICLFG